MDKDDESSLKNSPSPTPTPTTSDEPNKQEAELFQEEKNTSNESAKSKSSSPVPPPVPSQSNCIIFYGVTYLGCATVNAPKSEAEIHRIMSTLNEQGKAVIEVTMSVPQSVEEKIILFDSSNNESKISEYKMAQVLFVVRGSKNSPESNCFAFTTCHGDSMENLMFSCHVFRCNLVEAVSKILYSFWTVFNRQQQQIQQQQQQQPQQPTNSGHTPQQYQKRLTQDLSSTVSSTAGQLSSVATSLLGSLYGGIGSLPTSSFNSNNSNSSSSNFSNITNGAVVSSKDFANICEFAVNFVNGRTDNLYVFRATLDIKEEDPKNPSNFISVPKEKEFFKLRKNLDKQINIQIQQLTNQPLEIERCFGLLMCQGRNVSHKDMQLLHTISMGKTGADPASNGSSASSSNTSSNTSNTNYNNSGYIVTALWKPLDNSIASSLQVLNEETQKNARVFMTIAVDLVINGLQDPVRFCIETKVRVYPQNEKFWVYQKNKHFEEFFLQIVKTSEQQQNSEENKIEGDKKLAPISPTSNNIYSLHSIHSQTELLRKKHAIEHQNKIDSKNNKSQKGSDSNSLSSNTNTDNGIISDDENEVIMSGLGNVSKDCPEDELMDWSDLLSRWRKTTWNERPRGLQQLVRKGIPEALRGEVWQLLAGCNEDEKMMNESYRLLLSKDSPSENVILRDINRTFPGHQFFQDEHGQQALYKLSKAYSIYDEEVGYCQGLSFLIASLLLHMPEEQTFNLLVKIMYRYEVREIYKTNFECLHLRFFQLEHLMRDFLPELYEHFIDLNIEAHMYASQWFLTLFTAKFPLYMVFRILDLFLCEGFLVIFSIALALLKGSQRDLLALDFEGILKYFRVNMPKKYRSEQNFKDLMTIWASLHPKVTEKKLKKLEKNYKLMKEAEALKEDPLIRYEREVKRLTNLQRRLEQENDDLANEYIDSKIALSKQIEELRDENELVKSELFKYKTDYQNKLNESVDTNKKLMNELDQLKQLWRKESDRYESELERNNIIISEYKQICNTLSNKVEKWSSFKRKYEAQTKKLNLCDNCLENNKLPDDSSPDQTEFPNGSSLTISSSSTSSNNDEEEDNEKNANEEPQTNQDVLNVNRKKHKKNFSLTNDLSGLSLPDDRDLVDDQSVNKIKLLELELARVKLELVDAQCKNQEFDHKLKGFLNITPGSKKDNLDTTSTKSGFMNFRNSNQINNSDTVMSISTSSLSSSNNSNRNSSNNLFNNNNNSNSISSSLSNSSNTTLNSFTNGSANGSSTWLSKTLTQFKEATNQVVQKAQKVKLPNNIN